MKSNKMGAYKTPLSVASNRVTEFLLAGEKWKVCVREKVKQGLPASCLHSLTPLQPFY